jgi:hypothetical protein
VLIPYVLASVNVTIYPDFLNEIKFESWGVEVVQEQTSTSIVVDSPSKEMEKIILRTGDLDRGLFMRMCNVDHTELHKMTVHAKLYSHPLTPEKEKKDTVDLVALFHNPEDFKSVDHI